MNIKGAVNHFVYKLSNVWKPTQKDAEAINTIMQFVEKKNKKQYQDYHLFAKLYIMVYAQFLEKYKATVFDDIPRKELTRYLDRPLEEIVQRFTDKLNESELYVLFDDLGIELKHPRLVTEEVKKKEVELLSKSLKSNENIDKLTGQVWDYETVKDNLESQINNTINLLS